MPLAITQLPFQLEVAGNWRQVTYFEVSKASVAAAAGTIQG